MKPWDTLPIGAVCTPTEQRDPRNGSAGEFRYVDLAGIDRVHKRIAESRIIPCADAPGRARKVIRKDDVLVSTVRPNLNAVAMVPEELDGEIASTGFCVLRAHRELLDPRYLFYRVISTDFVKELTSKVRGANYPAVSDAEVKKVGIPVPTLSEQRRIVEILDRAEHLRHLQAEAVATAKRIPFALFVKMFGDPVTNPMGWPIRRFDSICESRLGKMLDHKKQVGDSKRPYLRNANVHWDRLELQEVLEMDFNESDQEEFRLRRGDVLVCEGGEVGRSAIWNDELPECYFQKALHRVRPYRGAATPEFVVFLLWVLARRGPLQNTASRMTFAHLTGIRLRALRIPVPPFALQEQFSARVRPMRRVLTTINWIQTKETDLLGTLLSRAFSRRLI